MLEKDPLRLEYISIRFVRLIFPIISAQHPVFPPVAPVDILLRQPASTAGRPSGLVCVRRYGDTAEVARDEADLELAANAHANCFSI